MQRILKLKNNLLTKAITSTEVSPQSLLRDTKFVLYCFRHYKYVDNDFNLKISNIILNNLHKYENSADKSRAMSLFVQVHLLNSLKISPSQSQVLLDNLQNTSEIPNLRWLINMGVIFQNSDINNPLLWKIIEQHYLNASSSFKTEVTPEELLKLAFIMSSVQKYSPPLWKALVSDIIGREETFNSSQRVMLFKSLAKINSEALFDQDFILTKFKPFMNSLIDAILKKKELLSLRELVGLLAASDEVGLLNEHILSEVEAQLFEKPALLSKKDVYGLMKIYTKTIHTKERKEFLRSIRKVLLSKFDKKISTEDANNFNFINNYLHKMNIIPTQEYNEPYSQFIIDDKFEIFEQLFVSRMKSSSMVEVMNFSYLVQGQLSKYILQLTPQTFLKLFNFLELRGEISETFLKLAFESCKKYLRPVHEKYLKEQVYAYLVHIKYDTQYSKGLKAQSLARNTIQNIKDLNDSEVTDKVLKFVSQNEAELPVEFVNLIKEYYKGTMDKLREETLYELLSLAKEDDLKDYAFREKLEEYFAHNFKYMNVLALCKSYHLIKIIMSKEYTKLAAQAINQKRLTLKEIDYLTRKLDVMTPEVAQHIQECFKANKEGITWRSVEALGRIMLRVFKAGQKFDEKFIKELLGMLSAYQGYFNQKTLDKLIGAYGEINEKQTESQKISE